MRSRQSLLPGYRLMKHQIRAGSDGNVYVGVERKILRPGQDVDGAPDAVAPGLELHRVVVELTTIRSRLIVSAAACGTSASSFQALDSFLALTG